MNSTSALAQRPAGKARKMIGLVGSTLLAANLFAMALPTWAQSEAFPSRTVKIIVTFPPGGAGDFAGRTLARGLQGLWNQTVIVENQAGASGSIGAENLVRSTPDGLTLLLGTATETTVLPFIRDKLPYEPLTDMTPIAMTVRMPHMLVVSAQSPYKSAKALIAAAQARPGEIDYASAGKGGSHHLLMEYMMKATQTRFNEIPYKGGAQALLAVAAGEVQAAWVAVSTALPLMRSGRLLGLAVSTQDRVPQAQDVPSLAEQGYPGFDHSFWMGVIGPARMPPAVVRKIETDIQKVVASEMYREAMDKSGTMALFESQEKFARTLRDTYARNKATLRP